jgi:hypothetical protein
MLEIIKEILYCYKEAFRSLYYLFEGRDRFYNGMERFVRESEENVKKKGSIDFSKEIENCREILKKYKENGGD